MLFRRKKTTLSTRPQLIADKVPFEYEESYKALRTNFNFITSNGKARRIVITSTLRDEGKSSLAINLAISLAQADTKVLLIDADLRNPSLCRYLGMNNQIELGLSSLLSGNVKVGDCLTKTKYGVDLIAGGPIPPNPAELITSEAMKDLLKVALNHYDYIICDTPPVGVITDAAALSSLCDGVLYVIRHDFATKNQTHNAIGKLKAVNAKILGTIMTQYTAPKKSGKRYGYRYSEYKYGYGSGSNEK